MEWMTEVLDRATSAGLLAIVAVTRFLLWNHWDAEKKRKIEVENTSDEVGESERLIEHEGDVDRWWLVIRVT